MLHSFYLAVGVLEQGLVRDSPSEVVVAALEALLEVAGDSPAEFAQLYKGRLDWLQTFLGHISATGWQTTPSRWMYSVPAAVH